MTFNGQPTMADANLIRALVAAERQGVDAPILKQLVDAIPDDGGSKNVAGDAAAFKVELEGIDDPFAKFLARTIKVRK